MVWGTLVNSGEIKKRSVYKCSFYKLFLLSLKKMNFQKCMYSTRKDILGEQFECKLPYYFITLEYLVHISYKPGHSPTLSDTNIEVRRWTLIHCCQIILGIHWHFHTMFFIAERSSSASHFAFSCRIPFVFFNLGLFFSLFLTFISLELVKSRSYFVECPSVWFVEYCFTIISTLSIFGMNSTKVMQGSFFFRSYYVSHNFSLSHYW